MSLLDIFKKDIRNGEFRLFVPLPYTEELRSSYKGFADAIDKLSEAFMQLKGPDMDINDIEQMIYVVGRPHWGAKYRGIEKKLQLKYRTGDGGNWRLPLRHRILQKKEIRQIQC